MSNLYTFSLQLAQIAPNEGDGTFGAIHSLESTKTAAFARKHITDRSEGNSYITYLATQGISMDVQLDTAGLDFDALEVLTGQAPTSSNDGEYWQFENELYPYFGFLAQAYPTVGDVLLWLPRCKVTTDFNWKFEYGKIVVPMFKFEAIRDEVLGYTGRLINRPDGGALAFPPQIPVGV